MNNRDDKITNLAIIPARGGSKRLKNKNLLKLGGKPLISHTIEAAKASKNITNIIVSSDSEEILNIASKYEDVEVHKRDDSLSSDHSTALEFQQLPSHRTCLKKQGNLKPNNICQ